jgi:hypothetical protein
MMVMFVRVSRVSGDEVGFVVVGREKHPHSHKHTCTETEKCMLNVLVVVWNLQCRGQQRSFAALLPQHQGITGYCCSL